MKSLLHKPTLIGVQEFTATEVVLRVTAETKPMQHYGRLQERFSNDLKNIFRRRRD